MNQSCWASETAVQPQLDNTWARPLASTSRTPELRLENPTLNDDVYAIIEAADLDVDQEARLERELGRQYHLITRDDRLDTVATDIVHHFLGRGFQGKAMVVSIDKATALRMHDKVRTHWQAERVRVEAELSRLTADATTADPDRLRECQHRLDILTTTEMALIVSPGQNEVEQMKALGLDIVPHRQRLHADALDERFKDATDPLRVVFLCAMWLTGFDVPSCSTIYLDKPMRNHALMQAIARALLTQTLDLLTTTRSTIPAVQRFAAHLTVEASALFTFLGAPRSTQPTGAPNTRFAPRSSCARSAAVTAASGERRPNRSSRPCSAPRINEGSIPPGSSPRSCGRRPPACRPRCKPRRRSTTR